MHRMARDDEDRSENAGADTGAEGATPELTDVEAAVLEFERAFWKYPGAKDTAIHDRFGWTPTRYYQVLNALIDTPAALAADPTTVNRLRRIRAKRQGQRSPRRGGPDT
jgi:hypothetical protein